MRIEIRGEWHSGTRGRPVDYGQRGGDVVVTAFGRWIRVALYIGSPPGSNIGIWRTRAGELTGVNVRVGRRYIGPCLTAFVHTR